MDAQSFSDTLNISLGRDRNIQVSRNKVEEFNRKRSIGANFTESRGFTIQIRNRKSQAIKITVIDQIPVSVVSDIIVTPSQLSGGILDISTGKISWEFILNPQEQRDIAFQYEVRYPRRERVILE